MLLQVVAGSTVIIVRTGDMLLAAAHHVPYEWLRGTVSEGLFVVVVVVKRGYDATNCCSSLLLLFEWVF